MSARPHPTIFETTASPRISDRILAGHRTAARPPELHTAAEVGAIVALLEIAQASTVAIGHGRYETSTATASAVADAWVSAGGSVVDVVDWPAVAASSLRPARRLVHCAPDAWVIADTPAGFAPLARRLAAEPGWMATRTFGSASLDSAELIQLAGHAVVSGLSGASSEGGTWRFVHGVCFRAHPRSDQR